MHGVLLLLLFLQQEPSPSEQKTVDVRARAFFPSVTGNLFATADNVEGDTLGLQRDLGFDPPLIAAEAELSVVVLPWFTVRAHYWYADFSGSEDVTESFFFGGSFFAAGTRVDSSLEIQAGSLLGEYNLFLYEGPEGRWELGIQAGVEFVYMEANLRNALAIPAFTETQTFFAPVPQIGVRARAEFWDRVAVELWVHGGGISGIRDARLLSLEAGAEFQVRIAWGLFAGAGWRFFVADARLDPSPDEEVEFDLFIHGPVITVGYRF